MTLSDTIVFMISDDYKERFRAEYDQLNIRMTKLEKFIEMFKDDELSFEPTCSIDLLEKQLDVMKTYKVILEERAKLENVDV